MLTHLIHDGAWPPPAPPRAPAHDTYKTWEYITGSSIWGLQVPRADHVFQPGPRLHTARAFYLCTEKQRVVRHAAIPRSGAARRRLPGAATCPCAMLVLVIYRIHPFLHASSPWPPPHPLRLASHCRAARAQQLRSLRRRRISSRVLACFRGAYA